MQTKTKKDYLPANKVKTTFLIFFLLTAFSLSAAIFAEDNSLGTENIFLDSDQDGLSDTEELSYGTDPKNQDSDGDGYSDGAEIKSGYDPLKPAPGDKLDTNSQKKPVTNVNLEYDPSSEENLTEELSAKLAAMISSSEADSQSITVGDISSMIDENIPTDMDAGRLPEIDTSEINIKNQDYPKLSEEQRTQKIVEDEDEYLSTVLYIASNNLPHNISTDGAADSFLKEIVSKINILHSSPGEINYFNDLASRGDTILEQLNDIEVPESMIDIHIEGLRLAKYSISLKDKVKIDKNDPVSSIISLSSVESLLVMSSDFIEKIEKRESFDNVLNSQSDTEAEEVTGNNEELGSQ